MARTLLRIGGLLVAWLVFGAIAASAGEGWATYVNPRFGYSVDYPASFVGTGEADDGNGAWLTSGNARLTFSGGFNGNGLDGAGRLESRLAEVSPVRPDSVRGGDGWYSLTYGGGKDGGGRLFHEYGVVDGRLWASFILEYPAGEAFGEAVARMEETLALPGGGKVVYTLRNGKAYRNGAPVDCDLYTAPEGFKGRARYWAVIGDDVAEGAGAEEIGIRFFGERGEAIGFLSLESAALYRDIIWSPSGDRMVLIIGSGDRPESFFRVYDERMDMSIQLPGIRDELHWVDDVRFVFTCNLGRRGNAVPGGGDGFRQSIILYDTVMPAAIRLKDATDTHGFSLLSVADDGLTATVRERSVASPDDWADADRVRDRSVTVRIPATR